MTENKIKLKKKRRKRKRAGLSCAVSMSSVFEKSAFEAQCDPDQKHPLKGWGGMPPPPISLLQNNLFFILVGGYGEFGQTEDKTYL